MLCALSATPDVEFDAVGSFEQAILAGEMIKRSGRVGAIRQRQVVQIDHNIFDGMVADRGIQAGDGEDREVLAFA